MRQCGDCQLCCKLLPVPPLGKKANERCKYQKFGVGCKVYHTRDMPVECGLWNCRWLVNDDADELSRPDRSHYVIDLMPDYITIRQSDDGSTQSIPVVQVWVDPKHRDAHHDPALRRWLFRRAQDGIAALIRFDAHEAIVVFAPPFDVNGQWHEIESGMRAGPGHSLAEVAQALGPVRIVVEP
jgi:hypothetical protein